MVRTLCICFFLILFSFSTINAQVEAEVDSLLQLITASKNDSLKMHWYNRLRRVTYYSDSEESLKYTQQFLELAQKNNYPDQIALAQFYMGNSYVAKSDYNKALDYYLKASEYYESTKDSTRLSSVLNGIGAAYENNGNDSLSLKYFKKSQQISESLGDKRRNALALNNIANIYKKRGDIKASIAYLENALSNLTVDDHQYLKLILVNLANSLTENSEIDKAQNIYNSILKDITIEDDALTYIVAKQGLGNIALEKGDYKTAVENLEESFIVATEAKFFDQRYELMKDLIDAYSYNKDYKKGLDLFYEYHIIKDSIFTSEKDKNLTEAIQKYETVKKDTEIATQQLHIEKQQRLKNWLIIGAIFLSILLIISIIFYRKRLKYHNTITSQKVAIQNQQITELQQKSKLLALNSMIEGQEAERLRIAKDLHDGLGGLLSTVKAMFSTIQKDILPKENVTVFNKTTSLIDEACVEVRRISHNMMPHALSLSGLEGALNDLGETLQQEGIHTTIEIGCIPKTLDDTKTITIYRLSQELITNIRKHAEAKNVLIQLLVYQNKLTLTIEDDGKGFNLETAKEKDGLGIKSIFSRVEFLDGKIDFDTRENNGTTVTIQIPI